MIVAAYDRYLAAGRQAEDVWFDDVESLLRRGIGADTAQTDGPTERHHHLLDIYSRNR